MWSNSRGPVARNRTFLIPAAARACCTKLLSSSLDVGTTSVVAGVALGAAPALLEGAAPALLEGAGPALLEGAGPALLAGAGPALLETALLAGAGPALLETVDTWSIVFSGFRRIAVFTEELTIWLCHGRES